MKIRMLLRLLLLGVIPSAGTATPLRTGVTNQGRLDYHGSPATRRYEMRFHLCTAPTGGATNATVTKLNVPVTNGLFQTELDFDAASGLDLFSGTACWIEL